MTANKHGPILLRFCSLFGCERCCPPHWGGGWAGPHPWRCTSAALHLAVLHSKRQMRQHLAAALLDSAESPALLLRTKNLAGETPLDLSNEHARKKLEVSHA